MRLTKSTSLKDLSLILLISIVLFLLIDTFAGEKILRYISRNSPMRNDAERGLRIKDPIVHHALAKNFRGFAMWGNKEYEVCTNDEGMKSNCEKVLNVRNYDMAFFGDSFTEGLGLPYEKTFVGIIASKFPDKKIANFGVASYSPTIYYIKLSNLIKKGYKFKEVIVYIDISDIQDESLYKIIDGRVISSRDKPIKRTFFPILHLGTKSLEEKWGLKEFEKKYLRRHKSFSTSLYDKNYARSAWTFDPKISGYGNLGVEGSIEKSIFMMEKIHSLCRENNIQLSIGIYPWPGQILFDKKESRQVKIWRDFCVNRCKDFYNSFPSFFNLTSAHNENDIIKNYYAQKNENFNVNYNLTNIDLRKKTLIKNFYIQGDMHFNENGNKLISLDFLKNYSKN